MAKFTKTEVEARMISDGVVPLFYNNDLATCKRVLDACYKGGSRLMEFTNRGDKAYNVFTELVKYVRKEYSDMIIGSGSIMDAESTKNFIETGADFIVSPILNKEMAEICNQENILWSPGCGTLTEITIANTLGAEIVKLFPGSHMGPGFIKAVLGPCPWLKLMPTGGVSPQNLSEWFNAGAVCVGMGSKLIKKEFVQAQQFDNLSQHISDTLQHAQSIRNA